MANVNPITRDDNDNESRRRFTSVAEAQDALRHMQSQDWTGLSWDAWVQYAYAHAIESRYTGADVMTRMFVPTDWQWDVLVTWRAWAGSVGIGQREAGYLYDGLRRPFDVRCAECRQFGSRGADGVCRVCRSPWVPLAPDAPEVESNQP